MEDRERLAARRWETRDSVVVASSTGEGCRDELGEDDREEASSEGDDIPKSVLLIS